MADTLNTKPFYNSAIPNDWEIVKLGNIGEFKNGINKDKKEFGHGYPLVGLMDVFDIPKVYNGDLSLVNTTENERRDFNLQKGDVLFVRSSVKPVGVGLTTLVCQDMPDTTFSGFLIRFRINGKLDFEFKAHCFFESNFRNRLLNKSTISANTNINQVALKSLKIALPPLPEQRAIAKALSLMDIAINKNNQLIAQKELRKKWLMQNLLTGKKRLKGFSGEWKTCRLKEVFDRITRKNVECNTNVITISAQRGFVKQTDFFNKKVASATLENYFLVKKGEFCYNKSYSNGYPKGATKRLNDFDKAVVTTLYICFGIKSESKSSGDFFEQFFEANYLDRGLTKIAHEGGRAHGLLNVTPSDFFSLKITIPQFDEQTAIAKVLQAADKEIELLKAKTDKLREQKKGMMQVLLTGKKRLNYDLCD